MTVQKWKDLGRYVRVKERKDGTHAVNLMVPARHRTANWPKSIRLPEYGDARGSLEDFRFKREVVADSARLYSYLQEERRLETRRSKLTARGIPELAQIYLNSDEYRLKCGPEGQYRNRRMLTLILEWSESRGHPEFAEIRPSDINSQLRAFDDRPSERLSLRCMWNKLSRFAMVEFDRKDNPCHKMSWDRPAPAAMHIWHPETIEKYAKAAIEMGQPGLAAYLRVQYWIGQRPKDARLCKHDENYTNGQMGVRQGKTDAIVGIPLPRHLRDEIASVRLNSSTYLFNDFEKMGPFEENAIKNMLARIRDRILEVGDPVHDARTLRHSAACDMARLGLNDVEIASRTGHSMKTIAEILPRYMVDRQGVARQAAIKQHLASGGSEDDFEPASMKQIKDWVGDQSKLKFHRIRVRKPSTRRPYRKKILHGPRIPTELLSASQRTVHLDAWRSFSAV